MSEGFYDDPDLYDLVAPRHAEMEQFYVEAAGGAGRQVLELACGTGRFTVPLALSGAEVVAADLSETMVARARSRAAAQAVGVTFALLDMRNFDLGRRFDTVIIAANSLLHLSERGEFRDCFRAIARHLKPGGQFVFDVFVPSLRLLSLPPGTRDLVGTFAHLELGDITIEEAIQYDPIAQLSRADWYWSTGAKKDFRHTALLMRQIFPQELPLLLESGGLRLIERFGDFDRTPLTAESHRQVCVCGVE